MAQERGQVRAHPPEKLCNCSCGVQRGGAPADPCVCSRSSSACGCGGSLESRKQTGQALEVLGSNASLIYRLCDMG